ncbi:hypothetical protein BDV93DRAFT_515058 [Ceratobasidium sp. AG-I]|nr:hypothetical protein BDV93DRAFT_515058 [Ceratobasidium sp. AG-I]
MSNAGKRNWEPPEDQDPGSKRRAVGPSYAGAPPGPGLPSRPTGRSVGHSAPLASSSKEWNPLALKELTRGLRAFSLLDYDTHSGSYSIHPLVQEWIRDISPDAATVRWLCEGRRALMEIALQASRHALGNEHPITLNCMRTLATAFGGQGKSDKAEALETEVIEVEKRVY